VKIVNPIAVKGEDLAADYLKNKGYKIIERNYRKGYGEIDIVSTKNNLLVFVEVKTRTSNAFGEPFEQITKSKIRTLVKTSEYYKILHPQLPEGMRIDVISVSLDYESKSNIIHIENIT
jgi:putative endonuclease